MLEVKPYCEKYREDLEMVNLNTAYPPRAYEPKERTFLLNTYCDYYLDCHPDTSFAAVDENGVAQGYIFSCPDYNEYKKNIKPYVKRVNKTGFDHAFETFCERRMYQLLSKQYPAHLHIDINPGFQHQGAGSRMMITLLDTLKARNVKGVMLIMGTGNENAKRFYSKHGFKPVLVVGSATVMGKKL